MSRNSSGTYTLPTGNPVVSGTVIEANWANTTNDDIAAALTDSLSRSGKGSMSASLRIIDGTVSAPGLAFSSETGSGAYRDGAGDWYLTVLGNNIARFRASGVDVTGAFGVSGSTTLSGQTLTLENSTAYYPQIINRNKTADANGSYISLQKIRSSSIVQNGDTLGNVIFSGYDGAAYLQGAYINALVSATPGTNDMPTDLVFGTTPDGSAGPTERFRITNAGDAYIRGGKGLAWYDSTNTGYWAQYNSSGALLFSNGTERMRLDASGNLGIGTSSPDNFYTKELTISGAGSAGVAFTNSTNPYTYQIGTNSTALQFRDNTANAERMRIDSSGNLLVGTTALNGTGLSYSAADNYLMFNDAKTSSVPLYFRYSGTTVGSISRTTTATTYATSSDYRLKENIQPMQGALDVVAQLNPVTYTWKADGSDGQGFIAHELQAVVPDCVTGEKDAVDEDGKPVYQGIDTSFLVATLTAAIKELKAELDATKAEVAELKAAAK